MHKNNLGFTSVRIKCKFAEYLFLIQSHWILTTLQKFTDLVVNWSIDHGQFRCRVYVFHYIKLGQDRLRRSSDPLSVPTIHRPFDLLTRVGLDVQYGCSTMLGQVKAVQLSAFSPNYPQANRTLDQGRFKNLMLVLYYVRLGQVRLRRSDDLHSVPTILRPIGRVIRVG